jgi:hypothetical protein
LKDRIDAMAAKSVGTHYPRMCTVELSAGEVDAGAELSVTGRVSCPHGCDLRGQRVSIRNQDNAELASAELTGLEGEADVTSAFVLRAPVEVGKHTYQAILAAHERDGVVHEERSTPFSFATKAHDASVSVWGLPSAIAAGECFRLKVGVKCSAECKLTGRPLSIFDHEGVEAGAGRLLDEVWPGTSALYFAEVEAIAPLATGDYTWRAEIPGCGSKPPHAAGSFTFAVKVVNAPDCDVTVAAFDGATQTPVSGASVLLHPYRRHTDEAGVAKFKVTRGRYKLYVSGFNYIPYENDIEVGGDFATRVELAAEPEGQDDYRW